MTDKNELREKIKLWLTEKQKLVINEREDDNFYFSYWIWPTKKRAKSKLIPFLIGHLKKLQQGQDCILMGWG